MTTNAEGDPTMRPDDYNGTTDDRARVETGTHAYGYELDYENAGQVVQGRCVINSESCVSPTSHQCHGRFFCIRCLQVHGNLVRADGMTMEYVGLLNPLPVDEEES